MKDDLLNQPAYQIKCPVHFKVSVWRHLSLLFSGAFLGGLSLVLFSLPSYSSDGLLVLLVWISAVIAIFNLVYVTLLVFNPHLISIHQDGIDLRHAGIVKWENVRRIGRRGSALLFFEFDADVDIQDKIPFYFRLNRARYRREGNLVHLSFLSQNFPDGAEVVYVVVVKLYSNFLAASLGLDLEKKVKDLDKQKLDIFSDKIKYVFQDAPSIK